MTKKTGQKPTQKSARSATVPGAPRGRRTERWRSALRWTPALVTSVLIPLASPWLGPLRGAIEARLGGHYADVLEIALVAIALAGFGTVVASIRDHRLPRYGLLALALVLVVLQVLFWGHGNRRVDMVERVHLVEYALVVALYYAALRPRFRDPALPVLAVLAGTLVGVADETVQWLSAVRVGELRDVALDAWAAVIGALVVVALAPPASFQWRPAPSSIRAVRRLALVTLLACAALFDQIGVGVEIDDPAAGSFVSRYAPADLLAASELRAARWPRTPPPHPLRPLDREDPFLTEAGSHALVRNLALAHKAYRKAYFENLILERWYAPYLDLLSFANGRPNRWTPAMRASIVAQVEKRGAPRPGPYRSSALRTRLVTVPRSLLWGGVVVLAAGLWGGGQWLEGRLRRPPDEPRERPLAGKVSLSIAPGETFPAGAALVDEEE